MTKKVVIHAYAPNRAQAIKQWFPEAIVKNRYEGEEGDASCDLLILSGGPMSADASSRAKHQFLEEDFQLLQQLNAHDEKQPFVLGICLGAQLMTWAFGGTVAEGEKMLAGWNEIEILSTHPAFDGLVRPLQCEIHYNHIERLPKDADIVATSLCDNVEAFAIGTQFLGVGYHPEVTAEDMSFISKTYGIRFENLCSTTKGAKEAFEASQRFFENIRSLI